MIIQAFNTTDRVVKIKINGKKVEYSDSLDYPTYVQFERLIKTKRELDIWINKLKDFKTEGEIADDITIDMKKFGFKLMKEMKE